MCVWETVRNASLEGNLVRYKYLGVQRRGGARNSGFLRGSHGGDGPGRRMEGGLRSVEGGNHRWE
jgi:hypothetical protein